MSRHLLNPLANKDDPTPSSLDNIPKRLERDLRAYGALLIQQAGIMLEAPQEVMGTAQVLFQRFWFVTSLKHFGIRDIALGALFLSSKLAESPLRIRDIINSFSYLSSLIAYCSTPPFPSPGSFQYTPMDYFATEFYDTKDALVVAEMQILKRLGFQTQVALPYGHLVNYLQVLELAEREEFVSRCWGCLNDMLQTPLPALHPQSTLAISSIYLTSRLSTPPLPLPLSPVPWWTLFDAEEDDILEICETVLQLYEDWKVGEGDGNVWRKLGGLPADKKGVRELVGLGREREEGERGNRH
ncbi:cyclin-like protein [Meredithblackwellia eburnea MCA 4105]